MSRTIIEGLMCPCVLLIEVTGCGSMLYHTPFHSCILTCILEPPLDAFLVAFGIGFFHSTQSFAAATIYKIDHTILLN